MIARDRRLVEPAGALHAQALSAIHRRAFSDGEYWDDIIVAGQLSRPGVFALIAGTCGMILTRVAADEAEILTVAVVPELPSKRRRPRPGPGRRRRGALPRRPKSLFLEVSTRNPAARGLYQAMGFANVGRRRKYYADGSDALVLALPLP